MSNDERIENREHATNGAASADDAAPSLAPHTVGKRGILVAAACLVALLVGFGAWALEESRGSAALSTVAEDEEAQLSAPSDAQKESSTPTASSLSAQMQIDPSAASTNAQSQGSAETPGPSSEAAQSEEAAPEDQGLATTEYEITETTYSEPAQTTETASIELGMPSTSHDAADSNPQPSIMTVSVTVDATLVGGGYRTISVTVPVGSTAYEALVASGANVNARGTVYGVYVVAIDSIAEKEHGGMSGWVYAVNGVQPQTACSNYALSDGDSMVWTYVNAEY